MDRRAMFQKFVAFTGSVHQITNDLTKDLRPDSVTAAQYKIMEYIAVTGRTTPSDISDCMHMSMPNTSRELRKLTEKGLCEKTVDPGDRRKQYIRLSAKGEAAVLGVFARAEVRFAERLRDMSDQELAEIGQALELLHRKVFY